MGQDREKLEKLKYRDRKTMFYIKQKAFIIFEGLSFAEIRKKKQTKVLRNKNWWIINIIKANLADRPHIIMLVFITCCEMKL